MQTLVGQSLAERLRKSLDNARGNPRIRERLQQLAEDPAWLESIVLQLGPRHAVVRELLLLTGKLAA